jgi:hypothetical protein
MCQSPRKEANRISRRRGASSLVTRNLGNTAVVGEGRALRTAVGLDLSVLLEPLQDGLHESVSFLGSEDGLGVGTTR